MTDNAPQGRLVGVVAALAAELRPLRDWPAVNGARTFQSGPGPHASAAAAADAVAGGAVALVSWGVAGGLAPGLASGTIIVSAVCRDGAGSAVAGDAGWAAAVGGLLTAKLAVANGPLLSVDRVLTSPVAKAAARGGSDALAVDMESFAIGRVAAAHGLPWIALRVVADAAEDALPPGIERCVDEAGNTRAAGVLGFLLEPRHWGALAHTAACFGKAQRALAQVAALLGPAGFALPGPAA